MDNEAKYTKEETAFLDELTALSKKHGIVISGCGCCSSPILEQVSDGLDGAYRSSGAYSYYDPVVQWLPATRAKG